MTTPYVLWQVFQFGLLTLLAFRITRLLISDTILDVPRGWLTRKVKADSYLADLLTCPWCLSVWLTLAVYLISIHLCHLDIALPVLQAVGTMTITGMFGEDYS